VTDTEGRPYTLAVRNIMATNSKIHDELKQQLVEAKATGF
jgi:myo-inositol-1(or 4)-monophosphatase